MTPTKSITVSERTIANLRIARLKALDANRHSFVFEGNELDVRFAGHLIDYMSVLLAEAQPSYRIIREQVTATGDSVD